MLRRKVTLEDARLVSEIFLQHLLVEGVELFGSVSREAEGKDLDLIVLARIPVEQFVVSTKSVIGAMKYDFFYGRGYGEKEFSPREEAAMLVLGEDFKPLLREAKQILPRIPGRSTIDIYILPRDWRQSVKYLEKSFPQGDTCFWKNLEQDAKRIT
jgi:hypothetical protein